MSDKLKNDIPFELICFNILFFAVVMLSLGGTATLISLGIGVGGLIATFQLMWRCRNR